MAPERPAPPDTERPAKPERADAPLVTIRKAAKEAEVPASAPAAAQAAAPPQAPAAPSRAERRILEEQQREAERLRRKEEKEAAARLVEEQKKETERRKAEQKLEAERVKAAQKAEAERQKAEQKAEAERLKAEQKKDAERRRAEEAKDARKRERKHRRHSKRVDRRAAELDLRSGERVSLSISGWSRFRRATLVVTNYRVALITRMIGQVRWIPLEEVEGVRHRWFGAHSLVVTSPIEVLTLQKTKHQVLASFQQILESEVAEARKPGAMERHHGDITQEWCDRSTEIWDSSFGRLRLWVRMHPAMSFATLATLAVASYVLSTIFNS